MIIEIKFTMLFLFFLRRNTTLKFYGRSQRSVTILFTSLEIYSETGLLLFIQVMQRNLPSLTFSTLDN